MRLTRPYLIKLFMLAGFDAEQIFGELAISVCALGAITNENKSCE